MFFLSFRKHLRGISDSFQIYPWYVGWTTQLFKVLDLKQTVLKYLLPIKKPIANYDAIVQMFTDSEQLSKQANIKYTHITLVNGVATKEFRVQWSQPEIGQKLL